ncbi:MAG: c-type cytochrome biogenesis protein CcmI [Rubrivivax sp.]|nr:c-type cytochrome biogenesis protein CcmI [Rubrivivax sp.]
MTPQAKALNQQLRELRAQHAAGSLTDKQFNTRRAQIERQILDHLDEAHTDDVPAATTPVRRAGVQTWALLGVFILAVAALGYGLTGSPDQINQVPGAMGRAAAPAAGAEPPPHDMGSDQMAALVEKLADRMKSNPQDAEGWVMLGRSYAAMGRADDALVALDKAVKLQPQEASILADYADALAVKNGRTLDGEPMQYIERALKADPNHVKSLVLAGTAYFNRGDYAGAVRYWDRVAQVGSPDNPLVQVAADGAAEARSRGQLPAAATAAATPAATAPAASGVAAIIATAAAPGPGAGSVSGTVSIHPDLLAKTSPDDAVFIFARAESGSRMPLALMRKQVKDLPVAFTLDDSMAMSPAAKISGTAKLVLGARVSKSGQAMPQAGDLEGLSETVAPGGQGVKIQISGVIK